MSEVGGTKIAIGAIVTFLGQVLALSLIDGQSPVTAVVDKCSMTGVMQMLQQMCSKARSVGCMPLQISGTVSWSKPKWQKGK